MCRMRCENYVYVRLLHWEDLLWSDYGALIGLYCCLGICLYGLMKRENNLSQYRIILEGAKNHTG
jgi:hypothetical protein